MDDDFDDILGTSEDDEELEYAQGRGEANRSMTQEGAALVQRGATPGWFASVLGIGRTTVNRKLADVAPKKIIRRNNSITKLYNVRECMPYLVQPRDMKEHIARMNPKDLPERLRKEFWGARKLEQDVRLRSKDLWQTADVHKMLGDLMKLQKDSVTLWTDDVHEAVGLSNEQVAIVDNLARKLLSDFADAVTQYCEQGVTRSQEAEFEDDDET